jgi:outer membrane receptor protein involved in Fe transport
LNSALFYIDWKDIPVGFLLPCGYSFGANAGKASSRGAEVELQALLTRSLTFNLGGSYTKAILEQDTPPDTGLGGVKGDRLPGIPEWNLQAGLEYDIRVAQHSVFGRVDYSYVSGFLNKFPGDSGVIGESGNYGLLNVRFGCNLTDAISAEIFAQNLTDKTVNLILDTEFADGRATIGQPRTVGLALRMRY